MISCSVGIAMYPDGCSHAKLIARADAAMYASKRAGGSSHCFYRAAMDADARDAVRAAARPAPGGRAPRQLELVLPAEDRRAERQGHRASRRCCAGSIRRAAWSLPSVFIPIAERFGLIGAIGNWVIEDACRQAGQWRDKGLRMRVAINLSAHQMRQDDIVERIDRRAQAHTIHPSLLTCEITESVAMEDTQDDADDLPRASASSACTCRSTTSAPATRAWPTCASCRPRS